MTAHNYTIFISGKSKFKKDTTEGKVFEYATLGVEMDIETEQIIDVDCTFSSLSEVNFIAEVLKGKKLTNEGFKDLYQKIENRFIGINKTSLLTALKNLKYNWDNYLHLNNENKST